MDIQIPDNLPTYLIALFILIRLLGPALSKFLFEKFPNMADKHFSAQASDKADRRDFTQQKELELLRADLKAKDEQYKQQVEREKVYTDIINRQFDFLQNLSDNRLLQTEQVIIKELSDLKASFGTLQTYIRGGWTRDKLLNRLSEDLPNLSQEKER